MNTRYIYIDNSDTEYWIETDESDYAIRQIVVYEKSNIQISCKMDCLAEDKIIIDDLDGQVKLISSTDFNEKWTEALVDYQDSWVNDKRKYTVGKPVIGKIKYFYPQGVILQIDDIQGICDYIECKQHVSNNLLYPDTVIKGEIVGYDDNNMWLIISNLKE